MPPGKIVFPFMAHTHHFLWGFPWSSARIRRMPPELSGPQALILDYSQLPKIDCSFNGILFCERTKLSLTSGPLHGLFPLPR